ncbi:MAG: sugar ABC transporter ATP-binding protein, partial [bacterium]
IDDNLKQAQEARRVLDRLHAGIDPAARVRDLPVARQQLVEVAKALSLDAKILVMDEPTAALTGRETRELFRIIRSLKTAGVAMIYITHRLDEARAIGDRVTVMRDGRDAGTFAVRAVADARLIRLMVGRTLARAFPPLPRPGVKPLLEVEGLGRRPSTGSGSGAVGPVSLHVNAGEVFGLAGLIGSGRTEFARCLVGADHADTGSIRVAGRPVRIRSPRDAKRLGICLLPEDRKGQGLVLGLPVMHNVTLASLNRISRFGWLNGRAERTLAGGLVKRLDVRTPGLLQLARNLSGGNQQKLVLAKWLAVEPRVLVFDEPTRGIDVGARFEVYKLIAALARSGAAVILISSDLTEVLGMSHRVGVMHDRRLAGILPRRQATPERVMRMAMGLGR